MPAQWVSSDVVDYGQHHVGDIRAGLPWADGTFEGIVANHSLQSLTAAELPDALVSLHRVLAVGGWLRVLVPNVVGAFLAFENSDHTWPGFTAISEPWSIDRKYAHYLTWGGQNRSCFTAASLAEMLDAAGFVAPPAFAPEWMHELDSRLGESLVVEAMA